MIGTFPEAVEEWKWRGVPVREDDGIICTGETYYSVVKLTFAKGASLKDPQDCSTPALKATPGARSTSTRPMQSDQDAFKTLIRAAAAALNSSKTR